ncbi:MAG: serine hydrolase domain-containing protein [Bacteroidia bacterium]|nr:serine hydrolase domain-containing protein [Bacteroidia bacterium]
MKRYFVLALFLSFLCTLSAQLDPEKEQAIDELFSSWDAGNHPGGAVGIMKEGEIIYSKGFGLASLEYKVPNSYGTIFNIASVSKQFTSMGIVRLEEMGKLSVDDDIRKYLPELPDFGHTITLRHCMYHTSGMRSLHAMLGMAGWRGDDSRTDEDLFRFMKRQKELNFAPGEDNLYCNTGYMLLAVIIERLTEEPFSEWMKKNVFLALGMNHTYVEDDYSRVVPNNATSYYRGGEEFSRAVEYWGYVGSGNMHSTVEDLLYWMDNFRNPKRGWEKAFRRMQEVGKLNNGTSINYAFGININEVFGKKFIGHGGAIGGFRSNVICFPQEKLNIVVLGNFSSSGPQGKVFQIAEILMDVEEAESESSEVAIDAIQLSSKKLKQFEGDYWNLKENYTRKIYEKDDTLRYFRSEGNETILIPISENSFQMMGLPFVATVSFKPGSKKSMIMRFSQANEGVEEDFERYTKPEVNEEFLQKLSGVYYSPELDTHYTISTNGKTLTGYHNRHGEFTLSVKRENYLSADHGAFGSIKVKRDKKGEVAGFYVSNGRVRNMWFVKR